MDELHSGLWFIMPPELVQAAVKHGNTRQYYASQRRAKVRYAEERPHQLQDNHIWQAVFEAGTAHVLGLKWHQRVNTDHDIPRLDLPNGQGAWPRACPKFERPARLKGVPKDYGYLISGRIHEEEVQSIPVILIEVRCYALVSEIKESYPLLNPGNRKSASGEDAACYMVPWSAKEVHPIEHLIPKLGLKIPRDVMYHALPSVSEMIDMTPLDRGMPVMTTWPICPHCRMSNFPRRTTCYHCEHDLHPHAPAA